MKTSGRALTSPTPRIEPTGQRGSEFAVIVGLLVEIRDELRLMNGSKNPACNGPTDRELLTRLLPAIVMRMGSETCFKVSEICADAVLNELTSGISPHKLGMVFANHVGVDIDGLCIEKSGTEHSARLWVVRVSGLPQAADFHGQ